MENKSLYEIGFENPIDYIKRKAKEGAMEGVDKKIPEIKATVRKEAADAATKAVTPIVKKGMVVAMLGSSILSLVLAKAMR